MKKENYMYGGGAALLITLILGITFWVSMREVEEGRQAHEQETQENRNQSPRAIEQKVEEQAEVTSVTEADAALEEMESLAKELEAGEETKE